MQKLIVLSISAVLFLAVLFLDQNRAPVPVKLILGDPTPIGLSFVMLFSMFSGVVLAVACILVYKIVRRGKRKQITEEWWN